MLLSFNNVLVLVGAVLSTISVVGTKVVVVVFFKGDGNKQRVEKRRGEGVAGVENREAEQTEERTSGERRRAESGEGESEERAERTGDNTRQTGSRH